MNHVFRNSFAICAILAIAALGGMQARSAIKHARARRFVAEAAVHLKLNDFQETSRCLHAALQANPSSVEATKLTADLLEATGSPAAISWRIRASQLKPRNMEYRLDWAQTAVKLRDLKSVEDALSGLDEDAKSTARYHKLAGALAWGQHKTEEAERHYQEARRLEPGNPSNLVNLSTIGLSSTNEQVAASARLTLQALAATNSAYALDALRRLAQEAARRRDLPEALSYTRRVATNSAASFADKLDCLNLLTATRSADAASWLAGLEQQATNSPVEVVALGRSLLRTVGPTNTLTWLSSLPHSLQTNQPVPLIITDCQIAVQDWPGLLATVANQDWGDSETLRLALESLARHSLQQEDASQTLWKRAQRNAARRLDRLYPLAQLAGAWGWVPERKDILVEIVSEFPREKWAANLLIAQLIDDGQTGELEQLLSKLAATDPGNVKLKASLARLCLLRKSQLPTAHRLAKEAFDSAPEDPLALTTYAYSLLLQGQQDDALRVLATLKPQALQIPSVAACYGVVEARSGNKQAAREPLERAQGAKLFPEEMELVRQAAAN
jgi:predicted Zn-dependent protease